MMLAALRCVQVGDVAPGVSVRTRLPERRFFVKRQRQRPRDGRDREYLPEATNPVRDAKEIDKVSQGTRSKMSVVKDGRRPPS